ncbi:MAG: anthranilate phosphoribosyltransferase [Candidatus Omnitrophica bacterium]|nr:anthranilate phosphoribosyltransferase [Candidatus Omnitrophota bacterium]MBU1128644.1 anthranilate phosphoribosyltransferase [Candidatus Omnitrophota bacterium]MBU1785025.1 anthranilate phosphoribosyltransferase [Candidatus Omnitrophota bacterium]MBU1852226.1 anthranilate phosphoribosyltransferase [Candidatus Omnitrophota bacterium]
MSTRHIKNAIRKITGLKNLTEDETRSVFNEIMSGDATLAQVGAFLAGLHMKGETVDEITGAAKVMREKAVKINAGSAGDVILDTCGTGGTGKETFNISTAASFVAAGCGVKVAKHGNRASSGRCGSADVLEALGVKVDAPVAVVEKCINDANIGFLFAPLFHKAMKYAAGPRKEIGTRTIFNLLGPLSNPAGATCQVMGVYDTDLTETMAEVLGKLGVKRAYVVHGENGFDEVSITGRTKVSELKDGRVKSYDVTPEIFGIDTVKKADIEGGDAKKNAVMMRSVLNGEKSTALDIVLANAGMALVAAGCAGDFKEGTKKALVSITSGMACRALERLIEITNSEGET